MTTSYFARPRSSKKVLLDELIPPAAVLALSALLIPAGKFLHAHIMAEDAAETRAAPVLTENDINSACAKSNGAPVRATLDGQVYRLACLNKN